METVERVWDQHSVDTRTVERLCDKLGCDDLTATVLANRGITEPTTAERYLQPATDELHDPELLPDMGAAVSRIETAIDRDETITVYGDRDPDGVTGTAILTRLFEDRGATVGYAIPEKYDGFGLNRRLVRRLAGRDTDLLITVDCGTTDRGAIEEAKRTGMSVIVTDHHDPGGTYPDATACINPHRSDSAYPHRGLTGAGIAFKLGQALVSRPAAETDYFSYALPLAGIGTVADYGTLTLENRSIVRSGFDRLDGCPLPGLTTVADHCDTHSIRDLGWSLAPLLNAAREDESGDVMFELLLATERNRAQALIDQCETYREDRREERRAWRRELESNIDKRSVDRDVVVVETSQYTVPETSTISERLGKPVVAYHPKNGGYYGGGRSDPDVDLRALFEACDHLLEDCWGHPGAAGFFMADDHREAFEDALCTEIRRRHSSAELRPRIEIDAELRIDDLTVDLGHAIERLRPFGDGFEEPQFRLSAIELDEPETFGHDDAHLSFEVNQDDQSLLWWNGRHRIDQVWEAPGAYDVVGTVAWDSPSEAIRFDISDMRPTP